MLLRLWVQKLAQGKLWDEKNQNDKLQVLFMLKHEASHHVAQLWRCNTVSNALENMHQYCAHKTLMLWS